MADTTGVTRRPWFWALLALLSVAGGAFALRYYTEAFPVLSVDLRMTRGEALDGFEAHVGLPSLDAAHEGAVDLDLHRKGLLRETGG